MNQYFNPVRTFQGHGSLQVLRELLRELLPGGGTVLLLAWDESVFRLPAMRELQEEGSFHLLSRCFQASNPTVEQLFEVYKETKENIPDAVIAVGGGSVLDVGKSLCCLYGKELHSPEEVRTLILQKAYGTPSVRWIGVPTTAGTGSEVTCWATIWDPEKQAKRSVESKENYAYAAVVDPDLTMGMPVRLAVSSALDAAAHAVESYWAKGTNVTSRMLALGAIRTIMTQIDGLLEGKEGAAEAMSAGSLLAGLAFSNTKTTACHSISYPLTMKYKIPHGTAVSMLLGPVFSLNQAKTKECEPLLAALDVTDAEELELRIQSILKRAGIPSTLREWNARKEELPELALLGITKGRADNNPVDLTPEMIQSILEHIY